MTRPLALLLTLALLSALLGGCSAGGSAANGVDVAKAQPLLDAAAEATADTVGGAGFEGQMSASFFTDLVCAALREGALTPQNSPISQSGGTYVVRQENQENLYALLGSVGSAPGWSGSGVSIRSDSVALTVPSRHPLMPRMRFDVTGVSPCPDYPDSFALTAMLRGENDLTGTVEYGRYTVIVTPNAGAPFGCTLAAVRAVSSILSPGAAVNNAAAAGTDAVQTTPPAAPADELSAFFGYTAADALEDWTPILRAAADSCLRLEYNLTGTPDSSMLWYVVSGAVSVMGSQLPGVEVDPSGLSMLSDDMIVTVSNFFAEAPETVPAIPQDCTAFAAAGENGYTFTPREVTAFKVVQYQMQDGQAVFTMTDEAGHRVSVSLCKNEASGYGVSIAQAAILP